MRVFAALLLLFALASFGLSQDLGIAFISRSPLYARYKLDYRPIQGWERDWPFRVSVQGNTDPRLDKQWPSPGETVTFTGHVRNHGSTPAAGFRYVWRASGQVLAEGVHQGFVNPGQTVTVSTPWTWPPNLGDRTIRLEIDPDRVLPDPYRANNTRTDYTNSLSFSIWIEAPLYERFSAEVNGYGTRSFEDWIHWQFEAFRRSMTSSRHLIFAPLGVSERVRIDKIVVVPFDRGDINSWREEMASDPDLYRNDGRWQFVADAASLSEKERLWDEYIQAFVRRIDGGLVHELMHQIGVIDMYQLNLERVDNLAPTRTGQPAGRVHYFPDLTLMAGGYADNPQNDPLRLDETSSYALQTHRRKRRGYYGEYLWDTPARTVLRFRTIAGKPLANATLAFFQKASGRIPATPVIVGRTDANGKFTMPNRPVPKVERTATGHQLKPNPFGAISVVGDNGVMLVRIRESGQEEFRWLEIVQLCEEFWKGNRTEAVIDIQTNLTPGVRDIYLSNIARKALVTASSDSSSAALVSDGQVSDKWAAWRPDGGAEGEYIQFDLKGQRWINTMVLWPVGDGHDWYDRFKIEVSATGAFAGEQKVLAIEDGWDRTRNGGAFRIQKPSGLQERVDYRFAPTFGRHVRITGLVQQNWVGLREVEIYPCVMP